MKNSMKNGKHNATKIGEDLNYHLKSAGQSNGSLEIG